MRPPDGSREGRREGREGKRERVRGGGEDEAGVGANRRWERTGAPRSLPAAAPPPRPRVTPLPPTRRRCPPFPPPKSPTQGPHLTSATGPSGAPAASPAAPLPCGCRERGAARGRARGGAECAGAAASGDQHHGRGQLRVGGGGQSRGVRAEPGGGPEGKRGDRGVPPPPPRSDPPAGVTRSERDPLSGVGEQGGGGGDLRW